MRAVEFFCEDQSRHELLTLKKINALKLERRKREAIRQDRIELARIMYGRADIAEREHEAEMAELEKRKLAAQTHKAEFDAKRAAEKYAQEL